jgi:archaeal flagellar protein FlaJ
MADLPREARLRRDPKEAIGRVALLLAFLAVAAAAVAATVPEMADLPEAQRRAAHVAVAAVPIVAGLAIVLFHPVDRLRRAPGDGRPRREAGLWTRLKVAGLFLHLLTLVAGIVLAIAVLSRLGLYETSVEGTAMRRGLLLLDIALGLSIVYALRATLRTGVPRTRSGIRFIVMATALVGALVLSVMSGLLATGRSFAGTVTLEAADLPVLVLAAEALCALALVASRGLPGIAGLLQEGRLGEAVLVASRRSVFLPILGAFSLLFLVFLMFVVFGVGVTSFAQELAGSPALLGVLTFLVLAFFATVAASFSLARGERGETPLFRRKSDRKRLREHWILGVSAGVATALLVPAFLLFQGYTVYGIQSDAWIDLVCAAVLIAIGPYGFYQSREHRRIRQLEERFPDFLRDIASSHKGGLTLSHAALIAARGEYGPLTPEVKKMADQLQWNVSFNEALQRFADRVQTPLVQRAVMLILQANKSGGATTEVLLAAARDAREIKTLETERRLSMSLYTVVIYVTFFVFLGVVSILYSQFIPQLVASSEAAAKLATSGGASIPGISSGAGLKLYDFQLFYFLAALVQGVGDGIVAGLMGQGKAVLGLRHAFLMVLLSYVVFRLLLV